MGYLDSYITRRAFLDQGTDANTTEIVDIVGYEVVGVAMPAALDDALSEMTFEVDPGDSVFREVNDDVGTPLTLTNITQGQIYQVQEQKPPIVGARLRLQLNADEAADRVFFVMLVRLPGSAD